MPFLRGAALRSRSLSGARWPRQGSGSGTGERRPRAEGGSGGGERPRGRARRRPAERRGRRSAAFVPRAGGGAARPARVAAGCACAGALPAARCRRPPVSGARAAGRRAPPQPARPRGGVSSAGRREGARQGARGRVGPGTQRLAERRAARRPAARAIGEPGRQSDVLPARRPQVSASWSAARRPRSLAPRGPARRRGAAGRCPGKAPALPRGRPGGLRRVFGRGPGAARARPASRSRPG